MKKALQVFSVLMMMFIYGYTQPGQLDPSFGNGGKVIVQNLNDNRPAAQDGMAIQPDGKIIIGGTTINRGYDLTVFRLLPNGKLDSSFGENGSVSIDYAAVTGRNPVSDDYVRDVAITPEGKIVILGFTQGYYNQKSEFEILIVRLNQDGSRDSSFDGDGIKSIDLVPEIENGEAVSILPGGEILIAGRVDKSTANGFTTNMIAIKLKYDGQPDETFGINGISQIDMRITAYAIAVQQDGKIIAGGGFYDEQTNSQDFAVVRLLPNGRLDPSFSEDGVLIFDMGGQNTYVNSIAIQGDEKIVVTGIYQEYRVSSDVDIPVARINKDGSFDFGFDFGGTKLIRTNGTNELAEVVLVDSRNNILIGFTAQRIPSGDENDFAVYRLTPEGNLDTRFDEDGKVYIDFRRTDHFGSMRFQTDGKLVLGGRTINPNPDPYFAIARLQYEPNPDITSKATYIGPNVLGTPCYGCQTAIIPLRATVIRNEGNLRNTRVKFVDRDNNTDITGWITASKLIEPNDLSMATVDATWYVTLSYAQPVKNVRLGMVVDFGDAIRNNPADDETITLYMPQNDVVSGGGELFVSATSKGKYKANEGSVTMFGFYAQSKPGLSAPDGYMNMWYSGPNPSGMTVTYKLEIDAMKGLGVNNTAFSPKQAEFRGTGKLWQENGPTRILVEDNVTVQTKLVDGDDVLPNEDSLTVYIWNNNNVLVHTSNWFINEAIPQPLWNGQVTVHNGSSFDESSSEVITQRIRGSKTESIYQKGFTVAVLNNPTRNEFVLNVKSTELNVYSIRVTDLSGRVIETRNNLPVSNTLRLGSNYKTGMFFAEIRQGKQVKTVRLIKQ